MKEGFIKFNEKYSLNIVSKIQDLKIKIKNYLQ